MEIPRRASATEVAAISQPARQEIDWGPYADGDWWMVHDGPASMQDEDWWRALARIKVGTQRWAKRNGYVREMRRRGAERRIWVRFVRGVG